MHQVVERYHVDDNVSIQPMSFSMTTQMNSLNPQIPHMVYEGPSGQVFCREPGGQVQVCVCFAAHAMCACGTCGRFLPSLCIVLASLCRNALAQLNLHLLRISNIYTLFCISPVIAWT